MRRGGRKALPRRRYGGRRTGRRPALARRVAALARQVRKIPQTYHLGYALQTQEMSADYVAVNLCNYTPTQTTLGGVNGTTTNPGASLLFGTQADDLESNRIIDQSLSCQLKISANTETDNITYTCYLVSLKDAMNQRQVFNPDTGALDLVPNVHYWVSSLAAGTLGMVQLNPKCFNIKRRWKFTIGNNGQALTIASAVGGIASQKTIYFNVPMRQTITNIAGDVYGNMATARDPSKQYYLLMFNDDRALDVAVQKYDFHAVRTVKVYE